MLRVRCYTVMDRVQVVVHCTEHGPGRQHLLASKGCTMMGTGPVDQLHAIEEVVGRLLAAWNRGEWDFTDEC